MLEESLSQAKVSVGLEAIWTTLKTEMSSISLKLVPHLIEDVQIIEGGGGLGSVFYFKFTPNVPVTYEKEKIVELDESNHVIELQVIEGGHLDQGFSKYKTCFKFTKVEPKETLIDLKVVYETETDEETHGLAALKTEKSALAFIQCLEKYLLNEAS